MIIDWSSVEQKWQNCWQEHNLGVAKKNNSKPKFMMIFAYPGISGFLHVGHMRGYSYTDAICRYQRLLGKEVLFPVGTHASGNHAYTLASKIAKKDVDWIDYLCRNGCSEKELATLNSPQGIIHYFNTVYVEQFWKKFGFLCDWKRFTCTSHPDYEKFIQWQFKKLQEKNLLIQKPYFATACVQCGPVAVDPSETDISKGGNAEKVEYTLLKFAYGDSYLVAATLRPETIYGQTNLWINPNGTYVRAKVGAEKWILSDEAAKKLSYQIDDVMVEDIVPIQEIIYQRVKAPGINRDIPVLPATFCDPTIGTGIVTSVPSDAPYDAVALEELKNKKDSVAISIHPISILQVEGYGQFPAYELIRAHKITSIDDPRLADLTKELYALEHHKAIIILGPYTGKRAQEAKEMTKAQLLSDGKATIFYDLSEQVLCRCGNEVVIKRLDNQWFIRYSDEEITKKAQEHSQQMVILPEEYKQHLPGILSWFDDRACARLGKWVGSRLPFDEQWIVEPISDSTLYPAYYIVSGYVNTGVLSVDELTEAFFDYVFLGKGKGKEAWKPIREEFLYFYPLDLNLGGKEHKTVHFPVFLLNHVALLNQRDWPKGIVVNGWVTGKGSKISKSKGGAQPIPDAIKEYGVDAMRLYYAHSGSPHTDVVWTKESVLHYKQTLERVYGLIVECTTLKQTTHITRIDKWLLSRMSHYILQATQVMNLYNIRELASIVFFSLYDDMLWYSRRGGHNTHIIQEVVLQWAILMNPITPHLSEEIYSLFHKTGFASVAQWPQADTHNSSLPLEAGEELLKDTIKNIREIKKLAKENISSCEIILSFSWKYRFYQKVQKSLALTRNIGEILREVMQDTFLQEHSAECSKLVVALVKDPSKIPLHITSVQDEKELFQDAIHYLTQEVGIPIVLYCADDVPEHLKAKQASPGRVGLLLK